MSSKGKPSEPVSAALVPARAPEPEQLNFEIDFFSGVLQRYPDFVDALRVLGNNLTIKGRFEEGLRIDKRLVRLRPHDALAHYNLACSYSLLRKTDLALRALRKAIELGYRDVRYILEDHDLDFIRSDPRFRQLLQECRAAKA
jgi:tetratricopeptide (TPR) repeat protein